MKAFYELGGTRKIGAIIRDHDMCFLAGRAIWCNRATDPLLMEAMSYKDGLVLAQSLGNCKMRLWGKLEHGSAISFDEFTFVHANQLCNRVAHFCAI
jgi:hypothetical protein